VCDCVRGLARFAPSIDWSRVQEFDLHSHAEDVSSSGQRLQRYRLVLGVEQSVELSPTRLYSPRQSGFPIGDPNSRSLRPTRRRFAWGSSSSDFLTGSEPAVVRKETSGTRFSASATVAMYELALSIALPLVRLHRSLSDAHDDELGATSFVEVGVEREDALLIADRRPCTFFQHCTPFRR
jgi:hypothetical protein